jgi:hypothetical protein
MKRLTAFTLIFLASSFTCLNACADYYPYGEDLRFTIFSPRYFGFRDFGFFYYSGHYYSEPDTLPGDKNKIPTAEQMNVDLWRARCNNVPSVQSVHDAIYGEENYFTDSLSTNTFVQYLVSHKDVEAFYYLGFARNTSVLADNIADPWERSQSVYLTQRDKEINGALKRAKESKDEFIRMRYAFLAIRMAYYNNASGIIKSAYEEFFVNREKKHIIDYWAMHFRALVEEKGAKRNYLAAQVFTNAPDKRWAISDRYDREIPVADVLKFAKTKKEKAAVWFLGGIRTPGRAIESLTHMYSLNVNPEGLSFLLVREVNKLEDWIYTPYYTKYDPAVSNGQPGNAYSTEAKTRKRIRSDRAYAKEVLAFVNGSAGNKNLNQLAWQASRAYLLFMTENDSAALAEVKNIQFDPLKKKEMAEQVEMIKALSLVRIQPDSTVVILESIKELLLRQAKVMNYKFIFAVARELEFKGNRTDAAILISKLNKADDYEHRVGWKKKPGHNYWFREVYEDYFRYIDAVYSTGDIENMITAIETNAGATDKFSEWKYSKVKKDLPRLYDLMGTKYLRENKLQSALKTFEKVNDTLWTSKYTVFSQYLNANPFYTDMYNEHKKTAADTICYDKESITRTLIGYLAKAEDVNNKDRDYYYFLVANCYFNMSQYGNSWMMKRYGWGSRDTDSELLDDKDYSGCDIAKRYYLQAKSVSKRKKFAALCLRMAGRCEKYRLWHEYDMKRDWSDPDRNVGDSIFAANKYYNQLQKSYPAYYDDLISNCYSFETFFKARR